MVEPNGTEQRLRFLEQRMTNVETDLKVLPRLEERYAGLDASIRTMRSDLKTEIVSMRTELQQDIRDGANENRGLRKILMGVGVSVVTSSLIFALTVTNVWGPG